MVGDADEVQLTVRYLDNILGLRPILGSEDAMSVTLNIWVDMDHGMA